MHGPEEPASGLGMRPGKSGPPVAGGPIFGPDDDVGRPVLNRRITLRLALGTMVLGVPAWVLVPSLEFCPAGQMRLGPN